MKHMKKSMFITTLAMVVVLVVALSTATFAWYTANSKVGASITQVTSATSSTASLVVDEVAATSNMASNSTVDITLSSDIEPMIFDSTAAPTSALTYTAFKGMFETFTLDNAGNLATASQNATPSLIETVKGSSQAPVSSDCFYLTNTGGVNADMTAKVTIYESVAVTKAVNDDGTGLYTDPELSTPAPATIEEAGTYYTATNANDFIRVALFANDNYVDTWALTGKTNVAYANYNGQDGNHRAQGQAPLDSLSVNANAYTAKTSGTSVTIATNRAPLAAGAVKIQLVVWFEGDLLTNAKAGSGAQFKIDFGASNTL